MSMSSDADKKKPTISKRLAYIGDYAEQAAELKKTHGRTELYSTGSRDLDIYLHGEENHLKKFKGGYGRVNGYEIVLLFGPTGIGKSTVALNLIAQPIRDGVNIGLLVLEDDMADVSVRLSYILSPEDYAAMNASQTVRNLPIEDVVAEWSLDELLAYIESWFEDGVELILLDHIQFAFEGAESIKGENEYAAQRVFIKKLNALIKKHKKTIIIISHVNKNASAKGNDRVQGSGAIVQGVTKSIELDVAEDTGNLKFRLRKSRFAPTLPYHYEMKIKNTRLESAYDK